MLVVVQCIVGDAVKSAEVETGEPSLHGNLLTLLGGGWEEEASWLSAGGQEGVQTRTLHREEDHGLPLCVHRPRVWISP